jgi:hypothetical protein
MGLMYAWATKEYLLWNMTIGQIVMYLNKGIEIKLGINNDKSNLSKDNLDELKKIRDEMKAEENKSSQIEEMKRKYGEIEK